MPAPSKIWDRFAKGYARSPVGNQKAYEEKLRITRTYLTADMHVLEFGCGTGTTALLHAPFVRQYLATDFSARMIEIARGKLADSGLENLQFEQLGFDQLDSDSAAYDMVMGHSILHLMEDWQGAIAKVQTMLKPGGVFVSSTACLGGKASFLKIALPIGNFFGLLPLVRFFTVADLATCIQRAGFEIVHQWQPDSSDAVFIVARKSE